MWNKSLLKLGITFLLLSIFNILVIGYWWFRCFQTHSAFYCDAFAFGGILLALGIPALVLIGLSLILVIISRFYRKDIHKVFRSTLLILGTVVFVFPYCIWLSILFFNPDSRPRTYSEFNAQMEQGRIDLEQKQQEKCAEIRLNISLRKEGEPMPVLPRDCN